jgi:hypothetical protein
MEYIVDSRGMKTSVIIPFKKWEKINTDFKKLQNKLDVLTSIQNGIEEIKESKLKNKKLKTLSEFLNESNC